MNLTIVAGVVRGEPVLHDLPGGEEATSFDVQTGESPRELVPVTRFGTCEVRDGDEVVVIGRTRKRFWRAGERSQARTDVVAEIVIPQRQRARVRKAVAAACDEVAALAQ